MPGGPPKFGEATWWRKGGGCGFKLLLALAGAAGSLGAVAHVATSVI